MKALQIIIISLLLMSCGNKNKKEESKININKIIKNYTTDKKTYTIKHNYDNKLDDRLKKIDSIFLQAYLNDFELTLNNNKTSFKKELADKSYILDIVDYQNFILLTTISEDEIGRSLYFFSLSKNKKNAKGFYIGEGAYDESQFISYLKGFRKNKYSYQFTQINTNYEFDDKKYFLNTDSVVFKINFDKKGIFTKVPVDSIRIRKEYIK